MACILWECLGSVVGIGGADTACVITPDYTAGFRNTKIREILCKPGLY